MTKTKKVLALIFCSIMLLASFVPMCFAEETDIPQTTPESSDVWLKAEDAADMEYSLNTFVLWVKGEYYDSIQEVVESIDCEYIEDTLIIYPAEIPCEVIMVSIFLTDDEHFEDAQRYFLDKTYVLDVYPDSIYPAPYIKPTDVKCDIDGDGNVTAFDARIALRIAVGIDASELISSADIDGDGQVTAFDARTILRCSVGLD